jgi:hypothetical protein
MEDWPVCPLETGQHFEQRVYEVKYPEWYLDSFFLLGFVKNLKFVLFHSQANIFGL